MSSKQSRNNVVCQLLRMVAILGDALADTRRSCGLKPHENDYWLAENIHSLMDEFPNDFLPGESASAF